MIDRPAQCELCGATVYYSNGNDERKQRVLEMIMAWVFTNANEEPTFNEEARTCVSHTDDYYGARDCLETIWKDRDATMRHCANDEAAEINCIWEGTESGLRYIDIDGVPYYIRLDHMTLAV